MLFTLLKELVDRFIEFLLHMSKGDSPEAQLTSALKSTVFLITVLSFVLVTLGMDNLNLRIESKDYESSVSKLGFLLNKDNTAGALAEISKLTASIDANSNTLRTENMRLTESNVTLVNENYWLQVFLASNLKQMTMLKENNDALLKGCVPTKPN